MAFRPSGFADEQLDWHPERMTSYRYSTDMASLLSGYACVYARWTGGRTLCRIIDTCLSWSLAHRRCRFEIGLSLLERRDLNKTPENILGCLGWVLHWTGKLQHRHLWSEEREKNKRRNSQSA